MTARDRSDRAAREGALVLARADWGTLEVTGSDRLSWLQGLVTCDVGELPPGEARWGLVLSKPGKIQSDVIVATSGARVLLALPAAVLGPIAEMLSRFLVMEDAELEVGSARWSWGALHGPRSVEVAAQLARELGGESAAVNVTGLGGAVLWFAPSRATELAKAVASLDGVAMGTPEDWARLAVERLVPELGADMGPELNPHEASLDRRCVSWTKGCYLGQEAVCMQDMRGRVKRRLVLSRVLGDALPEPLAPVMDEAGAVVGKVTRAVQSNVMGGVGAILLVAAGSAEVGTRLVVGGAEGEVVGTG